MKYLLVNLELPVLLVLLYFLVHLYFLELPALLVNLETLVNLELLELLGLLLIQKLDLPKLLKN
jgi:hypothetical protein